MNELIKKGKEYFKGQAYNWQLKLPLAQQLKKERDDYKEAADKLLEKIKESSDPLNQTVGEGLSTDPTVHMRNLPTDYGAQNFNINKDGFEKDDDATNKPMSLIDVDEFGNNKGKKRLVLDPHQRSPSIQPPRIDIGEIQSVDDFNNARLAEADYLERFFSGNQAWMIRVMTNKNRVLHEIETRSPSFTSQMEPNKVTTIKNVKILGTQKAYEKYEYRPLPTGVEYGEVKQYYNGRMRIDLYGDGKLLNPSIEDREIPVQSESVGMWSSILRYFGFQTG